MNLTASPLARAILLAVVALQIASLPTALSEFGQIAYNVDGGNFWSAGATAGTTALTDPSAHAAWQLAHHIRPQVFVYPPGWAWFLAPVSHLPPLVALAVNDVVMLAIALYGARIAARVYGLDLRVALAMVVAWYPVFYGIEIGQNAPLAMLLALFVVQGLAQRRPAMAGIAAGALLYKPTLGVVFLLLLLARREWRAFFISGACAAAWYLLSVAASAGDWAWPVRYVQTVSAYYHIDYAVNAYKSMTLPTLLLAAGMPMGGAFAAAVAVFGAGTWLFAKRPVLEAASMAGVVALAGSLHAWPYDLAIMVPAICYVATRSSNAPREAILLPAYALAATWWLVIWRLPFDPLAIVTTGAMLIWFIFGLRQRSGAERVRLADAPA
jgi:Glycosyltransferase family 87